MARKILVVDDEPNIRLTLEMRLRQYGFDVELAGSGQEALDLYRDALEKNPYDLIVLDIVMPGMSGLEVLERIRRDEFTRRVPANEKIPILMLTALKDSWKKDAESDGCTGYMVKPFKAEALLETIETFLRSS